jgi:RNA polymerase sigma-70 factor (ECF subfamily)
VAFRAELDDFEMFYERTYPAAYRTALGICADPGLAADAVQDAYLAAYRQRSRFRGEAPAGAWLQRIVVNAALSSLRRRRVRWLEPFDALRHDHAVPDGDPAEALALRDALTDLPPRVRAAVVLRYYHDLDYATIAAILETSPGNVGSMLSRALVRLRGALEPDPVVSVGKGGAGGVAEAVRPEVRHGR